MDQLASVQMEKHKLFLESDLKREEMFLKFKQDEAKKSVNTNLKWQKLTQMQRCIKFDMLHQIRAVIVIFKLPHKLLRHPLCFEIPDPSKLWIWWRNTKPCSQTMPQCIILPRVTIKKDFQTFDVMLRKLTS